MRYLVDFESFVVQANTYDEAWRKAKIIAHEHDWDLDDELLSGKEWCENDDIHRILSDAVKTLENARETSRDAESA